MENLDVGLESAGDSWVKIDRVDVWWKPLVARADCLRTLCLRDMDFDTGTFDAMKIRELPFLTHLTLQWLQPLDELFSRTGPFSHTPTARGRPFPVLQSLELLNLEYDFDFGLVFNFIKDRWSHRTVVTGGREQLVFEGRPDTINSVIAMYNELDLAFAASGDFYGKARVLNDAGVVVKIDGPPKPPPIKPRYNPLGVR